ncbi:serpentine type 7TM GPCR receptor class ab chemoreceptor domain-containing protein [Ditylenchus destructor]|uniref:Serpentine type 7TM GPCR receptor class ab chemoreceptor domain-containing protein n=1 Tax=Ditylenchus destructor TaxID=166010 RepID=A0AAD4QZ06_9BILA|nr:serpentine type 7TM GPCR receptor class ab chemoreceptor domain-containing protein [Ditylenchus destructor]
MNETTTLATLEVSTNAPVLSALWNHLTSQLLPVFCWCLNVLLISIVLFCYRYFPYMLKTKKGGLSMHMIFLLGNHLLNSAVFIFSNYVVNPLFVMLNIGNWLDPWWSFWVGNYLLVAPAMVFFVVVDRYLALVLSFKYTENVRRILKLAEALCVIILYSFDIFNVLLARPYTGLCHVPGTENNPVIIQECLPILNRIVNFTFQILKVLFPAANFIISILFLRQLSKTKIPNLSDGIVKMTIVCELLLDILPGFLSLISNVTSIYLNLNTYLFLMASLDAAICSVAYTRLLFNFKYIKQRLGPAGAHQASTTQSLGKILGKYFLMSNTSGSSSYNELCERAKAIRVDTAVICSEIGQVILSTITLILIIAAIISYIKHKISLHPNLMLLFANITFLYTVNSIFIVIAQGRYQILLYLASDPCDFLTPVWLNILLRVPGFVFVTAIVFSHFALTTERAKATVFARRYEKEGVWYPMLCIAIIWTLTISETVYVVVQALRDPKLSQPLIQVSITTETNATFQVYMNLLGLALVIVTAIVDYALLVANRKNRSRHNDYSLSRVYQIKENIDIINFIWPLDVWFAVVYLIHLAGATYTTIIKDRISYAQYVANYDILYMVLSIHSIVTLLVYLRFVTKCRSRVAGIISEPNDPTRTHFEQLNEQWITNLKRR